MPKPNSYGICLYKIERGEIYIFLNKTSSVSDWNFFKGKREEGETSKDTALREMYEESNILIEKKNLEKFYNQYNKNKNIGIFLVDKNTINFKTLKLEKKEIYDCRWINIKDEISISKNQKEIYKKIISDLYMKFIYLKRDIIS